MGGGNLVRRLMIRWLLIPSILFAGLAFAFIQPSGKESVVPKGERYKAVVPDTLDLAARGALAINGLTGTLDPDLNYEHWFQSFFYTNPAFMTHEHPGGIASINPKYSESLPQMRVMSGSSQNLEYDLGMMNLMISQIEDDGLFYVYPGPNRPWHGLRGNCGLGIPGVKGSEQRMIPEDIPYASLSGNAKLALGLMQWYQYDKKRNWASPISRIIQGLDHFAVHKDGYAYFADAGAGPSYFGEFYPKTGPSHREEPKDETSGSGEASTLIWTAPSCRAAARWYIMSGDHSALRFARELKNFMMRPKFWKDIDKAQWQGHWHGGLEVYRALLDYAIAADDYALKLFVRRGYKNLRRAGYPEIGWFDSQGCAAGRIIALAIKLSDAGMGDYWDDVDQYIRNMGVEYQITDAQLLKEASLGGKPHVARKPYWESDHDVIQKNIGAFFGNCEPAGSNDLMQSGCCTSNGTQGLFYAWEAIIRYAKGTARINLLLNRASAWVDIDSYLPYEGKVVLRNKRAERILVRVPGWANKQAVQCTVDDRVVRPLWDGNYAVFDNLRPSSVIVVAFPVVEWSKTYSRAVSTPTVDHDVLLNPDAKKNGSDDASHDLTFYFKGGTCVDISPRKKYQYPLFVRDKFKQSKAPTKQVTRYVAPVNLSSW